MNNRIIKFRAWDKKEKKMIEVQEMYFNWKEEWVVVEGYIDLQDFELMQYTGINDKSGKEIYENDIIETKGYVTVVRYEAPKFCCRYDKGKAEMMDFDPFEECEVIGNVYQNPELLK